MNRRELEAQFDELLEQVESFFNRKSEKEGIEALKDHRDQVLSQIPEMDEEILHSMPFYGAIGFLGKFRFVDCPETQTLERESSVELLNAVREKKALQLAENARDSWGHLLEKKPECLCVIVSLCYISTKNNKLNKRLQ